jgi:predicted peptidase
MPNLLRTLALARVFPEGEKIVAFALEYDCELQREALSPASFAVIDRSLEPDIPAKPRTITKVYRNDEPATAEGDRPGRFVILETDPSEKEAFAITSYNAEGKPDPFGPGPASYAKPGAPKEGPGGPPKGPGGGPGPQMGYCGPKPTRILVRQLARLAAVNGGVVPMCEAPCTEVYCPEVEGFALRQFEDLPYNLYIPQDYDPQKRYPLVLFVPDAGGRGAHPRTPLIQGIGGVIWASEEDQAKHPCFVVCPNFGPAEVLTHDDFTCLPKLYKIKNVLDEVTAAYSIDMDRIYTTGQSMGCMTSCELMCTYPDYFAGAVLVAGQWDPVRCGKAMAHQNLWILVSWNDKKAHPGMDAICDAIVENGGTVARSILDGSADAATLSLQATAALATPANVHYTLFEGDTVVPADQHPNPGSNHTNTWRVAYQIAAVRDWLFTAHK